MKGLISQMHTMKVVYAIIEVLENEKGHEESLKVVSKVLKHIGIEKMRSTDFHVVIEGSQFLWSSLMIMVRLSEKVHDPEARKEFFETYAAMREYFVSKQFGEDLDHLYIEAEHFVLESDSCLEVTDKTLEYIEELLRLKRFHMKDKLTHNK